MTLLTDHGAERAKERAGLSAAAAERLAARAFERGVRQADVRGCAHGYLSGLAMAHSTTPVVYGEFVFCFGANDALVTVLNVPREFRAAFVRALNKKKSQSNPK